jgi:hypothetical protein
MVLDIYSIISRRQAARIAMPPNAKLRIIPGSRRQDGRFPVEGGKAVTEIFSKERRFLCKFGRTARIGVQGIS